MSGKGQNERGRGTFPEHLCILCFISRHLRNLPLKWLNVVVTLGRKGVKVIMECALFLRMNDHRRCCVIWAQEGFDMILPAVRKWQGTLQSWASTQPSCPMCSKHQLMGEVYAISTLAPPPGRVQQLQKASNVRFVERFKICRGDLCS